jgi:hypothetical protein
MLTHYQYSYIIHNRVQSTIINAFFWEGGGKGPKLNNKLPKVIKMYSNNILDRDGWI